MIRWGVSPAWFISRCGGGFGPDDIRRELPAIAAAGFSSVQLEIVREDEIGLWETGGGDRVQEGLGAAGLGSEVFVAHCLLESFSAPADTAGRGRARTAGRIAAVAAALPGIETVVIPLPALEGNPADPELRKEFLVRWRQLAAPFLERGLRLCVEALPGSIAGSPAGMRWLLGLNSFSGIGLNLDTGHLNVAGIDPAELVRRGAPVYATHLCDNDGIVNSSSIPGKGTVRWKELARSLLESGYEGSWDIELVCAPDEVEASYREALVYLRTIEHEIKELV
jgi:sugar phosphate isomerase/epimerase